MDQSKIIEIINKTKSLNILYVEDNINVRNQTTKMLSMFFDNIDLANNGKEAFEQYKSNDYDIILTDIKMPEIDGITLIKLIRNEDTNIPILILSAHDDRDYLLKSIDLNVEGYILKPYNLNQIAQTIEKLLERNEKTLNRNSINLIEDFLWKVNDKSLCKNGEKIRLTNNEQKLFEFFIQSPNMTMSYHDIETKVFEDDIYDNRRVRNLFSRLKKKTNVELFNSVYGYGYELRVLKEIN